VVGFDGVVGIPLEHVPCCWRELGNDARVDRCSVGGDLRRREPERQGSGEECPRSGGVAAFGDDDVDDLAVLIDCAVEIGSAARDFDVGLVEEPAIAGRVPGRSAGIDELGRERLHPAITVTWSTSIPRSASSSSTSR
jgi:hypothetical protein